jgi:hypothetical protein
MLRYVNEEQMPVSEPLTAYLDPKYKVLRNPAVVHQSVTWSPFVTMDNAQDEFAIASMLQRLSARPFFVTTFATLCPKSIFTLGETLSRRWLPAFAA